MVQQLTDRAPVLRVLLQARFQEVPCLVADFYVGRDADVVFYDLYQLFLFCDFEGVLAHDHLVHHHSQRPDVDFFIVFFPLQNLRADV